MSLAEFEERLGPALFQAIERKGYAHLTPVQRAVLDPSLDGRDLRITSQTGSGKTLAIGLALRGLAGEKSPAAKGVASPLALIIAPTRELAHQVQEELSWLYADSAIPIASTTGGASYRDEHRALSRGPLVVVATPGRLLDHLERGSVDASHVRTVVLDEADRMLELGFREDLERIFERVPEARATHLVSATFPRIVRSLADRLQREPAHVQGTRLGAANADIDHVIHVVDSAQRLDALINLMLANPEDQTLVFVRTRADAAHIANELVVTGFAASALSGEMEQAARNRALAAFRDGRLRVLIATDVAARGIDVQGVTRVVHGELPTNGDAYTHRSGRTGRAGRKGTSSLLVAPVGVVRATRLLRGLGIEHRFEPIPTAEDIERSVDESLFDELTNDPQLNEADENEGSADDGETSSQSEASAVGKPNAKRGSRAERAQAKRCGVEDESLERWTALAQRLMAAGKVERTVARLLQRARRGVTEPRTVRAFPLRKQDVGSDRGPNRRDRDAGRRDRDGARDRDNRYARERPRYETDRDENRRLAKPPARQAPFGGPSDRTRPTADGDLVDQYASASEFDGSADRGARGTREEHVSRGEARARTPRDDSHERGEAGENRADNARSETRARAPRDDRYEHDEATADIEHGEARARATRDDSRERGEARTKTTHREHNSQSERGADAVQDDVENVDGSIENARGHVTSSERGSRRERDRDVPERDATRARSARGASRERPAHDSRESRRGDAGDAASEFVSFHVSWGDRDGADARRLLAMLCRRGQIRGKDVGAIRVESGFSLVQVAAAVAPAFARSASRPDPREPDIIIRPDRAQPAEALKAVKTKLRTNPFKRAPGKPGGRRPPKRHKKTR